MAGKKSLNLCDDNDKKSPKGSGSGGQSRRTRGQRGIMRRRRGRASTASRASFSSATHYYRLRSRTGAKKIEAEAEASTVEQPATTSTSSTEAESEAPLENVVVQDMEVEELETSIETEATEYEEIVLSSDEETPNLYHYSDTGETYPNIFYYLVSNDDNDNDNDNEDNESGANPSGSCESCESEDFGYSSPLRPPSPNLLNSVFPSERYLHLPPSSWRNSTITKADDED